ncbi:MAG: DUF1801 domain-containing protein [Cyclobacteriaceae bacterium]
MRSQASSVEDYLSTLPPEHREAISEMRKAILNNIPEGFAEVMGYGMIGYVVPHSIYPSGYHADPKQPLPFLNLGSQKNYIALYHMGLYSDPELLSWFTSEYSKRATQRLDMGKSCIRFKKPDQIPFDLIGVLASKITVKDWIARYESGMRK